MMMLETRVGSEVVSKPWVGKALSDKLNTDRPSGTIHTLLDFTCVILTHQNDCLGSECCKRNETALCEFILPRAETFLWLVNYKAHFSSLV